VEKIENGGRKLLEEILVIRNRAGIDQLADLGGEILPDARQRQAIRRSERRDRIGMVRDGL
jgi:hypothetical protein